MRESRLFFLLTSLLLSIFASGCGTMPEDPPATVERVELERYTGLWYEIARLPVFFQKEEDRATAVYGLNDDGTISIINTAIAPDGSSRSVTGTAMPVEGSNNARLKVTIDNFFAKLFSSPPDYGNYWILKLEPDYSLVLVGSPDRETLWLLAREPTIQQAKFDAFIGVAKKSGYETEVLIVNNGDG